MEGNYIVIYSGATLQCSALCGEEKGAQCVYLYYYYNPSSSVESRGDL